MSIAFERIEPSEFGRVMACGSVSIFDPPVAGRRIAEDEGVVEDLDCCSSSSSSSIGRNSDDDGRSSDGEGCVENEAESSYKGPLSMMDSLEEVLPIRRGISKFYNGKSKSFTTLAETKSSSSIKDIAKPDNAYTRRQRNILAINHFWDKNKSFTLKNNGGGISKRPLSSSRSSLALAMALSCSDVSSTTSEDSSSSPCSRSPSSRLLPPLYPQSRASLCNMALSPSIQNLSAWRSLSVADLPKCVEGSSSSSSSNA